MAHLIIINIMTIIQTVSVINLCDFVPMMSQLNNHMTANMAVLRVTSLLLLVCIVTGGPTCRYKHETKTYSQPLDHFSHAENTQFDQRYLINTDHWSHGGPIFFYTGNEGIIELFCDNTGFMWEIAPHYNAMVVFAEHRYYGNSLPFGADSFSDPMHTGYLTSEQALADYAQLITFLHSTYGPAPVVVFGGSYGGMLSAWFRIKYPWLCVGAIAASAPLWQFTNLTKCTSASDVISADIKQISSVCADNVHKSWSAIDGIGVDQAGLEWLTTAFQLCQPLATVGDLKAWLYNSWFTLAQVNYPYPANFMANLPGWPLNETCHRLSSPYSTSKSLLTSLAAAIQVYSNYTGSLVCLNLSQPESKNLGENGWDYQACTEMVMPMCSDGVSDLFYNNPWNLTDVIKSCQKQFKVTPQPDWIRIQYGGKNITAASNIVFSNGMMDPWSGGGVLESLSDSLVAILIPEGAHHLDLRAADPADPPYVKAAREQERAFITNWLKNYHY